MELKIKISVKETESKGEDGSHSTVSETEVVYCVPDDFPNTDSGNLMRNHFTDIIVALVGTDGGESDW